MPAQFRGNGTGGGPFARQWCTAKAGLVDFGYAKATGDSIQMVLPKSAAMPEMELEWKVPEKSNAIERDRARSYHQAYSALIGLHCLERALKEVRAGRTKSWNDFTVPEEAISKRIFDEQSGGPRRHARLSSLPVMPVNKRRSRRRASSRCSITISTQARLKSLNFPFRSFTYSLQ